MKSAILLATILALPIAMATHVIIEAPSVVLKNEMAEMYVMIYNVSSLNACNYNITFNSSILKIKNIYNGNVNGTVIPVNYSIEDGYCIIVNNLPNLNDANGDGYLCKIEFTGVENGKTLLKINGNLSDVDGNEIEAIWIGKEIKVTSTLLKIEAPDVVKSEFEAFLTIYNVSNFGAINLTLLYDKNLLNLEKIENGSIEGRNLSVYWNYCQEGVKLVALGNASGDGYVAKFIFSPKNIGITSINITNVTISDIYSDEIYAFMENKSILIAAKLPPIANFTFTPSLPYAFQNITFNASLSYDTDGYITTYKWDFNGDGIIDKETNESIVTYSYNEDGKYNVSLIVEDNDGFIANITKEITVMNNPPIANFSFNPSMLYAFQNITFNANSSYDIDGYIINYTWNFGDGNIAYGIITKHVYNEDGVYNVTLLVKDNDNAIANITKQIFVRNNPPTFLEYSPLNNSAEIGLNVTLSIKVYDKDNDLLTVSFYGNGDLIGIVENVMSGNIASILWQNLHYNTKYSWYVIIEDGKNSVKTPTWYFTTLSKNQPPSCSLDASPSSGYAPLTVIFSMTASDDGSIVSWQLDINNDGIAEYSGNGLPPLIQQHTYNIAGIYTAKLIVIDNDGISSYDTVTINVMSMQPQNRPPNVEILSPLNGSIVKGSIAIKGIASDDEKVVKVEIRIDEGEWINANGTTSWQYELNTSHLENGIHVIEARSYDGIYYSDIARIEIIVSNVVNHKPFIEILSPLNGSIVKGSIAIKGIAWDIDGNETLQRVEIRIDEGEWINANGTTSWQYELNTSHLENGWHSIEARCFDGVEYGIAMIKINVQNAVKEKKENKWILFLLLIVIVIAIIVYLKYRKII